MIPYHSLFLYSCMRPLIITRAPTLVVLSIFRPYPCPPPSCRPLLTQPPYTWLSRSPGLPPILDIRDLSCRTTMHHPHPHGTASRPAPALALWLWHHMQYASRTRPRSFARLSDYQLYTGLDSTCISGTTSNRFLSASAPSPLACYPPPLPCRAELCARPLARLGVCRLVYADAASARVRGAAPICTR